MRSTFINISSSPIGQENSLKVVNAVQIENAEEIVNLQLELDILKIILKEQRSSGGKMEESVICLRRELDLLKEELSLISKQYCDSKTELEEAKSVIEALESQQILAINEVEDLRKGNSHQLQLLSKQEVKIKSLKEQLALRELKDVSSANYSENDASVLKEKVKRMQCSLEKAKRLNTWYQNDREFQVSNDEEMDEVCRQAEAETAEVIVCLEEELGVLQREVQESHLKELEMKNSLMLLETELKEAHEKICHLTYDNQSLSGKLDQKDCELRSLSEEWSLLTSEIEEVLADGCELLIDASDQLEHISSSFPQKRIWISEHVGRMARTISEKELLIEELRRCLEDANNTRSDVESMLKSLRGAALVITEAHQRECSEKERDILRLRSQLTGMSSTMEKLDSRVKQLEYEIVKASDCATVAFIIVNRLAEVNHSYSDALKHRNAQLCESEESSAGKDVIICEQAAIIEEAEQQIQCLRAELAATKEICADLREKLSDEQERTCAIEEKLQDVEEQCISTAKEKLAELKTGVTSLISCMSTVAEQYRNPKRNSLHEDCTSTDQEGEELVS